MSNSFLRQKRLAAIGVMLVCSVWSGCIERPPSAKARSDKIDRKALSEILLEKEPSPSKQLGARFGDGIEVLGIDISPAEPSAGDSVSVTFYYRCLEPLDEDYKVFVHIDDEQNHLERTNADHWPAQGRYPTSAWRKGDIIRDTWSFTLSRNASGATLNIWAGFYQPGKDARYPLRAAGRGRDDGKNRLLAGSIAVH